MQVQGATLRFPATLWVQYDGVDVATQGEELVLTGREEDAYLKVFNHFGRVLKLLTFEDGRWIDTDSGAPATAIDVSQAGRLPSAPPVPVPAAPERAAAAPRRARTARQSGPATRAKPTAAKAKPRKGAGAKPTAAKAKPRKGAGARPAAGKAKPRSGSERPRRRSS